MRKGEMPPTWHTSGTIGLSVLFSIPFLQFPTLLFTVLTVTMHWTDTLGLRDLFLNGNIQLKVHRPASIPAHVPPCVHYLAFINTKFTCCRCSALCTVNSCCNSVLAACALTTMNNLTHKQKLQFHSAPPFPHYLWKQWASDSTQELSPEENKPLSSSYSVLIHLFKHGRIFPLISAPY